MSEGGFCGKPNPDGTRQMLLHGTKGLSAKGRALQCRFTKVRSDFAVAVSSQCFTVFLLNLRSHCLQCHLDQFVFLFECSWHFLSFARHFTKHDLRCLLMTGLPCLGDPQHKGVGVSEGSERRSPQELHGFPTFLLVVSHNGHCVSLFW